MDKNTQDSPARDSVALYSRGSVEPARARRCPDLVGALALGLLVASTVLQRPAHADEILAFIPASRAQPDKSPEAGYLKWHTDPRIPFVGSPVHERMTMASVSLAGSNGDYRPDRHDAYVQGAVWNDDPEGLLCPDCSALNPRTFDRRWGLAFAGRFLKAKDAATSSRPLTKKAAFGPGDGLLERSHFGDLQFLHAMASYQGQPPGETQADMLAWAEFVYKVSSGEIGQKTRFRDIPVTRIRELLRGGNPPANSTVESLFRGARYARRVAVGTLLHMIQDSYAPAHATRGELRHGADDGVPAFRRGAVLEFHNYSLQDESAHAADDKWPEALNEAAPVGSENPITAGATVLRYLADGAPWQEVEDFLRRDVFVLAEGARPAGPGAKYVVMKSKEGFPRALSASVAVLPIEAALKSGEGVLLGYSRPSSAAIGKDAPLTVYPGIPYGGKARAGAVPVGVVDSGVNSSHPQLKGYIREARDFTGEGLADELGHGTTVSLIVVFGQGAENAVSTVVSAKVATRDGRVDERRVLEAIDWVVEKGVLVVNLSVGFEGTRDQHRALCDRLSMYSNVLFVAAAGNSGPDVTSFPAACGGDNVLSVAAVDDEGRREPYSGRGDIAAPGRAPLQEEWRYLNGEGSRHARTGDHKAAKNLYLAAIASDENAESRYQLGLLELREGRTGEAIHQFRMAIQLDPGIAQAYAALGAAQLMERKFLEAEASLRDAIDLYPDGELTVAHRATAHLNLGRTLSELGKTEAARAEFIEAGRLAPDDPEVIAVLEQMGRQ